ncbi:MAG: hypothetical protein JSS30_04615 [Verrucomicrobia bacterium]|nr:hypothetical protein [Verrucomicrobiota bacterium]
MNYIQEPYFAVNAWDVIASRDLQVIDEKANFLEYAKTELLLVALCVAEVVELVARAVFSIFAVPYYFITGNEYTQYRNAIIYTALTIGMTGRALYHNLFSKFAMINSIGSASDLLGMEDFGTNPKVISYFNDVEQYKETVVKLLNNMRKYSQWHSGFSVGLADETPETT